jgi:hypothetical protein
MAGPRDLLTELAAEIAALPKFASLQDALDAINGRLGEKVGLRGKYMRRLYDQNRGASDQLIIGISASISRQCDQFLFPYIPHLDGTPKSPEEQFHG